MNQHISYWYLSSLNHQVVSQIFIDFINFIFCYLPWHWIVFQQPVRSQYYNTKEWNKMQTHQSPGKVLILSKTISLNWCLDAIYCIITASSWCQNLCFFFQNIENCPIQWDMISRKLISSKLLHICDVFSVHLPFEINNKSTVWSWKYPWKVLTHQGADIIWRCHLANMGIPIIKIRQSHDYLFFIMGIPIWVRQHLYTEFAPESVGNT